MYDRASKGIAAAPDVAPDVAPGGAPACRRQGWGRTTPAWATFRPPTPGNRTGLVVTV